jgi:hypothetical protein
VSAPAQARARRAQALGLVRILHRRGGGWVSSVELIRAGVLHPLRAVADARRHLGADVQARNPRGPGSIVEYRLEPRGVDAEAPRDPG